MKFDKLQPYPESLIHFFSDGLQSLGGVCERTWYDKLEVIIEGAGARAWDPESELVHRELHFPAVDASSPKAAETDVFPGCPLIFQLAETLWKEAPTSFRIVSDGGGENEKPSPEVLRRVWELTRSGQGKPDFSPATATRYFSMVFVVRLEIQSIEQHWTMHRIACSCTEGWRDHDLETNLLMLAPGRAAADEEICWPDFSIKQQDELLRHVLGGIHGDIAPVLSRQQKYLEKELRRIDHYFAGQVSELESRRSGRGSKQGSAKIDERIAATRAEHTRRREDQVQRHEVVVLPHVDAVVCVAERAWRSRVRVLRGRAAAADDGVFVFVPRLRRWFAEAE